MAFQQPQYRPQPSRPQPAQPIQTDTAAQAAQQRKRPLEESQEWVLFSPASVPSQTTLTSQTARTTRLSHISDFGSLETGHRSDEQARGYPEEQDAEDDGDLDSLDDGLHAFNPPSSPRLDHSGGAILPMHDGMGTFPTSFDPALNEDMQEQLWQYERYNPHRRRHRRRTSVQKRLDAMEEEEAIAGLDPVDERRLRVERWRLEQSKAVLEEIERETKRRQDVLSRSGRHTHRRSETSRSLSYSASTPRQDDEPSETFWQRITRRVIRDIIGLDENTLSVIFGEELPDEDGTSARSLILDAFPDDNLSRQDRDRWELRLLERIARELGVLVRQLSASTGAFSTYSRHGLETVPESSPVSLPVDPVVAQTEMLNPSALFRPTLQTPSPVDHTDMSLWGIEEEAIQEDDHHGKQHSADDVEYWERDLSLRMIFSFLRNRFSSSSPDPPSQRQASPPAGPLPVSWQTQPPTASALGTSPESRRRASLLRANHPLLSRSNTATSHSSNLPSVNMAGSNVLAAIRRRDRDRESLLLHLRRQHRMQQHARHRSTSSCASQSSAKRSKVSHGAGGMSSAGSRNYWDFPGGHTGSVGGSVHSASIVSGVGGGAGSGEGWGDV